MRVRASIFAVFAVAFSFAAFAWAGELTDVQQLPSSDAFNIRINHADGSDRVESVVALSEFTPNATCVQDSNTICLSNDRFRVTATYTLNSQTGNAGAVRLTGDTGYFWFFGSSNVEAVIKVIDGCPVNDRFWVFAGGLTDQQTTITVTDTTTGTTKQYTNPAGTKFAPVQDTSAFATCSAAPACTYAINPTSVSTGSGAANRSVAVTAQSGCPWTATSNASWLTITSGATGSGNGVVNYSVASNSSESSRSGTLTVADHTVFVTQAGASSSGQYDGSWAGSTSQGKTISFVIVGNAVSTISFGWHGTGGCTVDGDTTVTYSTPRPLSGNTFTLTGSGVLAYTVNGTFASANTANGSLSFTFSNPFPTCTASGSASWNATK